MTLTSDKLLDPWNAAEPLAPKLGDHHTVGITAAAQSVVTLFVFAIAMKLGLHGLFAGALALPVAYAVARYDCSIQWQPYYKALQKGFDELAKRRS